MKELNELALPLVKASLGYKSSVRDELLQAIIKSITDELTIQKRINLNADNSEHLMFIIDYTVFRYENKGGSIMPRNLEYRLRNLIIKFGGV
ncbi:MAG: hypothetical protein L0F96_01115 [Lactococcus lactis]|uniref:Prophage pi2 protein 35 n=1 Tax=Pseudolactococcus piscium MKFS47 TaxID=297352 RepID=A0A0D6DV13_9LACT|nr:hypothetical protein [Lactococcus piscium]MDN5439811.1 hypothetical protein [Lactococcus lactis]MDN5446064.1 hypothetical protein [Lactococcus lactis]MDN5463999.1 hypothetical protein [Lactococcus lactis]CEN27814.1 Prophage pi2 protein 35 [Lactococcus piscium MKFS47]